MVTDRPLQADPRSDTQPVQVILRRLYDAYNRRDADVLVGLLQADVDWPDGVRRLRGHAAVRAYWAEQWARTRTHDAVTTIAEQPDGRWRVEVDQVVRDLGGDLVSTGRFAHHYRFADGLVARMDVLEP